MIAAMLSITGRITTERLHLRPFMREDLDGLAAIQALPEVARFLYWEPRTRAEVEPALKEMIARTEISEEGESIALAVEPREGGRLLGEVTVALRSREHRQ